MQFAQFYKGQWNRQVLNIFIGCIGSGFTTWDSPSLQGVAKSVCQHGSDYVYISSYKVNIALNRHGQAMVCIMLLLNRSKTIQCNLGVCKSMPKSWFLSSTPYHFRL